MSTEPKEVPFRVPIRRTKWASFWLGVVAVIITLLLAVVLSGLLLLLIGIDGAIVVIVFGLCWFGLFFLSYPLQRRYARALDLRRPGISFANGVLSVPVTKTSPLHFKLDEPHELIFGWCEHVMVGTGPTSRTRAVWTHAALSQNGQQVSFIAEDSVREAQAANWPKAPDSSTQVTLRVSLWASDLVALVKVMHAARSAAVAVPLPSMTEPQPPSRTTDHAAPEAVREWPHNPLRARNRHEALLYLEQQKAETLSRSAIEGGEEWLGRTPESIAAGASLLWRFVFVFLESDPADENDFGSGLSKIFDPMGLMLLLNRLENTGHFGTAHSAPPNDAAYILTHQPTREVAARRRANARCIGILEQLMRFAEADGYPAEESMELSATRTYFQRTRERFDLSILKARHQKLTENLKFWDLPITSEAHARRQAVLVRALRERCPAYIAELKLAGFEEEQFLHPAFSHSFHLTRYAARALRQDNAGEARAAFAAWAVAEPNELSFPIRDFADAVFEVKVEPELAAPFIPSGGQHYFWTVLRELNEPDYNPYGY